jgi:hypothetical protein
VPRTPGRRTWSLIRCGVGCLAPDLACPWQAAAMLGRLPGRLAKLRRAGQGGGCRLLRFHLRRRPGGRGAAGDHARQQFVVLAALLRAPRGGA